MNADKTNFEVPNYGNCFYTFLVSALLYVYRVCCVYKSSYIFLKYRLFLLFVLVLFDEAALYHMVWYSQR